MSLNKLKLHKFKSSVLAQQCERIGEQILNYQKYIDPMGHIATNKGGWQSRFNMSYGESTFPFYEPWSNYLFELLNRFYVDYVEKFYNKEIMHKAFMGNQRWCSRAWFNINWPEDHNGEHHHLPNGDDADEFSYIPPEIKNDREVWLPMASGSFYVTDSHNTFFVSKSSTVEVVEEKERKYIDFNAGDFWIGDPGMIHGVGVNKQNVPRITISFNIEPAAYFQ